MYDLVKHIVAFSPLGANLPAHQLISLSSLNIFSRHTRNNPVPVYESPVKLVVVELKLDGEVDHDNVGGLGLDLAGLVGGLGGDEGEGGEGGPGEVVAVLGGKKWLVGVGKGKNLLGHSEELRDARLVGQAAERGACVG